MKIRIDIRNEPVKKLDAIILQFPESVNFMITAWQWAAWKSGKSHPEIESRLIVVIPDFLYYARLAGTGQAAGILKLPDSKIKLIRSALACVPTGISQLRGLAGGQFWSAAEAMMAYDAGLIGSFRGEVLLHNNLTDFAWFFEQEHFIRAFKKLVRNKPTWGFATQQIPAALSLCSRWDIIPDRIVYNIGYTRPAADLIEIASARQFQKTRWTLDLSLWPKEIFSSIDLQEFPRNMDDEWLLNRAIGLQICNNNSELLT